MSSFYNKERCALLQAQFNNLFLQYTIEIGNLVSHFRDITNRKRFQRKQCILLWDFFQHITDKWIQRCLIDVARHAKVLTIH